MAPLGLGVGVKQENMSNYFLNNLEGKDYWEKLKATAINMEAARGDSVLDSFRASFIASEQNCAHFAGIVERTPFPRRGEEEGRRD
ncbi:hypothetical protein EJ110_NYTH42979 [Nymphaea thermarum]|nr:hypothetical protein EJ110_NYTH42979 [Nymphaea thermarum]